jgi:hypothetical protein
MFIMVNLCVFKYLIPQVTVPAGLVVHLWRPTVGKYISRQFRGFNKSFDIERWLTTSNSPNACNRKVSFQ